MKKRISLYLVDDEPKLLDLLQMSLDPERFVINGSCQAREALKTLVDHRDEYDMAIIDHFMPDMLGTELIASLKSHHPNFPIIMATGYGTPELEAQLKHANYSLLRCLPKPYRRFELEALVEELYAEALKI